MASPRHEMPMIGKVLVFTMGLILVLISLGLFMLCLILAGMIKSHPGASAVQDWIGFTIFFSLSMIPMIGGIILIRHVFYAIDPNKKTRIKMKVGQAIVESLADRIREQKSRNE